MKTLLIALLFPLTSYAIPLENPCGGLNCTEKMLAISDAYRAGGQVESESQGKVFSGECYHYVYNLNPETTHYGFTMVDPKDGALFMNGKFSFFYQSNPYGLLTPEEARAQSSNPYDEKHRLALEGNTLFADMNKEDPQTPWLYWIRENKGKLILIGQWGRDHRLFCEFLPNP